jgi:hypothetical protein
MYENSGHHPAAHFFQYVLSTIKFVNLDINVFFKTKYLTLGTFQEYYYRLNVLYDSTRHNGCLLFIHKYLQYFTNVCCNSHF